MVFRLIWNIFEIVYVSMFSIQLFMYIAMFYPSYVIVSSKPEMKRQYSSLNINDVGTGKLVMFLITKERTQILLSITSSFSSTIFLTLDTTEFFRIVDCIISTTKIQCLLFMFEKLSYLDLLDWWMLIVKIVLKQ